MAIQTFKTEFPPASLDSPEILAPAGSPEALTAAIRCGADAVYFGGGGFNARRNAHNFAGEALKSAIEQCHSHGVRVHFTLNTLVREDEISAALSLAEEICSLGADALILQDLGLARRIHAAAPDMPLHASTQLSCHTPAGVRELAEIGFSRVVLAREMSRGEIAACANQGTELEIFVHGALCMCVSGQCELSAMLGGRSGNRGLCAQPCRLPFMPTKGDAVPSEEDRVLSLRDLSLYSYMNEIRSLGVCSVKIEGRMKRPEYVAAATSCFVSARDYALGKREKAADSGLLNDLQAVFSRSGFTDGYYTARRDSAMFGSRTHEDVTAAAPVLGRLQRLYDKETPRVPVKMALAMRKEEPLTLSVRDADGHSVTVLGQLPEAAVNRPLDAERASAQLEKTGGTPFSASVDCDFEDGLTVPLSAINALRRDALDVLLNQRSIIVPVPYDNQKLQALPLPSAFEPLRRDGNPKLAARFADASQVPEEGGADLTILPLATPEGELKRLAARFPVAVEIPRGLFGAEEQIKKQLRIAADAGAKAALCGNIGAIPLARQAGLPVIAGFGMNIANPEALDELTARGAGAAVISGELTFSQMRFALREHGAPVPVGILAYGRQPLMLMRNCPYRAAAGCKQCGGKGSLTDRKGVKFPLACAGGCTELLNSKPLYLADLLDELPALDFLLLHFTVETKRQAAEIIGQYRNGGTPPAEFTRGLYKRGVE